MLSKLQNMFFALQEKQRFKKNASERKKYMKEYIDLKHL